MYNSKILLSEKAQDLIKKLEEENFPVKKLSFTELKFDDVLNWFKTENTPSAEGITPTKQQKFLLAALRTELLKDLIQSFSIHLEEKEPAKSSIFRQIQFGFLVGTGTLVAFYDGYKGIVSFLGLIPTLPPFVLLGSGLVFSLLSVVVFYGFNLAAISSNLSVEFSHSAEIIDSYIAELSSMDIVLKFFKKNLKTNQNIYDIQAQLELLYIFKERLKSLIKEGELLQLALNTTGLKIAKTTINIFTGILYFSGGFFSGQTMILGCLMAFGVSMLPVSWPVILVGIVFGLGALCGYIWMERPGVNKFVTRLMHLDEDRIETLTNAELNDNRMQEVDDVIETALTQKSNLLNSYGLFQETTANEEVLEVRPRSYSL